MRSLLRVNSLGRNKSFPQNPCLQGLNPPQKEAVEHYTGPLLVFAGAGSGKTRVLTRRVANLVLTHKVRPHSILAVTFTNKAADEMRSRLRELLGEQAGQLWLGTFHAIGVKILRRNAALLSYSNDFAIYDDQDSKAVLKSVLKSCDIDEKRHPVNTFARVIDRAKNFLVTPDEFLNSPQFSCFKSGKNSYDPYAEALRMQAEVYEHYQRALVRANAMDFGDLLLNTVLLLQGEKRVREYFQHLFRFVLVDEFQDTNHAQYTLVKILSEHSRNLFVVGDDDQSIYAFRGASVRNILDFEKDFPEAKVIKLEQNYRSSGNILEASHAVIKHVIGRSSKKLWTEAGEGEIISSFVGIDERDEAEFIAEQIKQMEGVSLSKIALFYRTNAQSRALEEVFVQRGIPYKIFGGLKFYERKEVKDILAYLRILVNEQDEQSFLRIINTPPRGIGAQTVQRLVNSARSGKVSFVASAEQMAASSKPVREFLALITSLREEVSRSPLSALIRGVIEKSDYGPRLKAANDPTSQARLENLAELEALGRSMESSHETTREALSAMLDRIVLTTSADQPSVDSTSVDSSGNEDGNRDAVQPGVSRRSKLQQEAVSFMTLHLAKGLEFEVVFLTGIEEGLLPHYLAMQSETETEEERRLCYVGMTRAMRKLYLTRAMSRGMFSGGEISGGYYRNPSRFLSDIPSELLEILSFEGREEAVGGGYRKGSKEDQDLFEEIDFDD